MGELVDQDDVRPASQDRLQVHLGQSGPPVLHDATWHDLQPLEHRCGVRATVGLDDPDDDIRPASPAPASFRQHGDRLADAGGSPKVDPQPATRHNPILLYPVTAGKPRGPR